ncbi:dockerin type I repeat-containing protein [Candidatus Saccharibacteria bacterium]|nr:dockerin type I repeat-containing protein [Candidatus Saccharibacteria bacterium]
MLQKTKIRFSKISRRYRAAFALVLFLVAGAAGAFLLAHERQYADATTLTGSMFRPGNIISDNMFYAPNTMTAVDIQRFLEARAPSCVQQPDGPPCIKDFRGDIPARPADAYCNGMAAATNQSAAEMIFRVAQSCGINPQVILVTLQKEQGMITTTRPTNWMYRAAMGFACPDDAPCNDAFGGFFMQVYMGSRQFKVYRQRPDLFQNRYQAGQHHDILYNPNRNCGTQRVLVENQATQGLYIYTPYVPNAAALANLNGTGDSCSAYGNRNFWRTFWQWFGNPHGAVQSAVKPVPDLPEGIEIGLSVASLFELDLPAQQLSRVGAGADLAKLREDITVSDNVTIRITKDGEVATTVSTGALLEFSTVDEAGEIVEIASWTISVLGDVNGDGRVDIADLVAMRMHLAGNRLLIGEFLTAADILPENREVDITDIIRMRQFLAGSIQGLR